MATPPEVRLASAYTRRYNLVRSRIETAVGRTWDRLANVDDAAAQRFAVAAAGLVAVAEAQVGAEVDGYLALMAGGAAVGIRREDVSGSRGADPLEVYQRPIVTARSKLSDGTSWEAAMDEGRQRAVTTALTDLALAQRAATDISVRAHSRIVGYRRVLTGKSCSLCAAASTQRYRRGDLLPIHAACDCGVAPIIGDRDPGQVINRDLVDQLKASAGSPDYAKARHLAVSDDGQVLLPDISVRTHGELGPVLTETAHDFTGLADIA